MSAAGDGPGADPRERAIALLARREHSRRELAAKLSRKGFAAETVEPCLDELAAEGLLSDARYAESYTRARAAKGYGPRRIAAELGERGVEAGLAEQALAEAETDWERLAAEVRRKRFGDRVPADFKERARQMRFLQYRGFSGEQIRRAVGDSDED